MRDNERDPGVKTVNIRRFLDRDDELAKRAVELAAQPVNPSRPITLRQAWPEAQAQPAQHVNCNCPCMACRAASAVFPGQGPEAPPAAGGRPSGA